MPVMLLGEADFMKLCSRWLSDHSTSTNGSCKSSPTARFCGITADKLCLQNHNHLHFSGPFPSHPGFAIPPLSFFSSCYAREPLGISCMLSYGWDDVRVTSQQSQSTGGNSVHWVQPVAWPHHFLVYHLNPEGRGITVFMWTLWCRTIYVSRTVVSYPESGPLRLPLTFTSTVYIVAVHRPLSADIERSVTK